VPPFASTTHVGLIQVLALLVISPNYQHPKGVAGAWLANWLANSRSLRAVRRKVFACLPFPVLESDVRDVLYLNWVVPTSLAQRVSPPGVSLEEVHGQSVFTVLIYRHGNFGPRFLGPLRRLLPSPLQSNWRFYVAGINQSPVTQPTVLFVRNFFNSALYAVGTCLGSDALPSELPKRFTYTSGSTLSSELVDCNGHLQLKINAVVSDRKVLPETFIGIFPSWGDAVANLTLQDSAVVQPPDLDCLAQAGISLPIELQSVRPVEANATYGNCLEQLGIAGTPLAFVVPSVKFEVLWEKVLAGANNSFKPKPLRGSA
jgi:hypothetical protein